MEPACWGSNTGLATLWLCNLSGHICEMVRITLVDAGKTFRRVPTHNMDSVNVLYMCVYHMCVYIYVYVPYMCIFVYNRHVCYTYNIYMHTGLSAYTYVIYNI